MRLDVPAVQATLAERAIGGWLLYDFRGQNPTAQAALGLERHMLTRRWFYFIPAVGAPVRLVHAIERGSFPALPGEIRAYASRQTLVAELSRLLTGVAAVAMEYCPLAAIPYLSRVDAGTVELVRSLGPDVVSSADLVQWFLARWDDAALASHERASAVLDAAREAAFRFVLERLRAKRPALETEVQEVMMRVFSERGCTTDHAPIVAVGAHAADPHYVPSTDRPTPCRADEVLLLDLWCKENAPRAAYADITWMAFLGAAPSEEMLRVWERVAGARDAGFDKVRSDHARGVETRGFEVDRVVRDFIAAAGYGDAFLHRTGHSIGLQAVHGDGANLDDYETHDTRALLPGLAFSIEPGIYLEGRFGMRSEIDVFMSASGPRITTSVQTELERLVV